MFGTESAFCLCLAKVNGTEWERLAWGFQRAPLPSTHVYVPLIFCPSFESIQPYEIIVPEKYSTFDIVT